MLTLLVVMVRISVSLFDVPQNALAPELAPDYDRRTVLASFRFCFFVLGLAGMLYLLNAVFLHKYGMLSHTAYGEFGTFGAVTIFVIMMISSLGTQSRVRYLHRPPKRSVTLAQTFREIITTIGNPSLLALLASGVLGGAAERHADRSRLLFLSAPLGPGAEPAGAPAAGRVPGLGHRLAHRPDTVAATG